MRKLQVVIHILRREITLVRIIEDHIFMQTHQHSELRQNLIFNELTLGLVCISAVEVVAVSVVLRRWEVSFKKCESQQVCVC